MALAIDIMYGCGPSNKMRPHLQPKKTKVRLIYSTKGVMRALHYYITTKTEHFSFRSGCVIRVAKHLKKDWFIVLR